VIAENLSNKFGLIIDIGLIEWKKVKYFSKVLNLNEKDLDKNQIKNSEIKNINKQKSCSKFIC
jgi:hypothetical protein